jgi:hypothetical protein
MTSCSCVLLSISRGPKEKLLNFVSTSAEQKEASRQAHLVDVRTEKAD